MSPHSLRHAAITAALDDGCSLRDVQDLARHADPRQTRRYDRARGALDRNPTYIVATYLAGATGAPMMSSPPVTAAAPHAAVVISRAARGPARP
jgi:hypothetical protein